MRQLLSAIGTQGVSVQCRGEAGNMATLVTIHRPSPNRAGTNTGPENGARKGPVSLDTLILDKGVNIHLESNKILKISNLSHRIANLRVKFKSFPTHYIHKIRNFHFTNNRGLAMLVDTSVFS